MKAMLVRIVSLACLPLIAQAAFAQDESAPLFVLKRTASGFEMETMSVESGGTKVIVAGENSDVVAIILPVGQGGSGSVVEGMSRVYVVKFADGLISGEVRWQNGHRSSLPSRELSDLRGFDSRVSITAADGAAANFVIRNYSRVIVDSLGPVMNMFGDRALGASEYSLLVNTIASEQYYAATGEVGLKYSGRYLFVQAETAGGHRGLFAVDLGAYASVITEAFLPDSTETKEKFMFEHSSGGVRRLKYAVGGSTGQVESILGYATLDYLKLGDLRFDAFEVDVIKSLPQLDGRDVAGIIGLDILKAARYLTLIYGTPGESDSRLILSDARSDPGDFTEIPYSDARQLMYVRGKINGRVGFFLLDSGAPSTSITSQTAEAAAVDLTDEAVVSVGAGGQQVTGRWGVISSLVLGNAEITDVRCKVRELHAVRELGKGQLGGLLGNDVLSGFASITLDFHEQTVRLAQK